MNNVNEYRKLIKEFLELSQKTRSNEITIPEAENILKQLDFFDNTEFRKYFAINDGEFLCILSQEFSINNAELLEFYKSKQSSWNLHFQSTPCRDWVIKIRNGLHLSNNGPLELSELLQHTNKTLEGKCRLLAAKKLVCTDPLNIPTFDTFISLKDPILLGENFF